MRRKDMPLDTGVAAHELLDTVLPKEAEGATTAVSLNDLAFGPGVRLGAGLKAVREFKGLSLQDVADETCVRRNYLAALEAMDLSQLPSRPFTHGYIRAYAKALGLDEDRAIEHFRIDAPGDNEPLRAPVGVAKGQDPRIRLIGVGLAVVAVAIIVWNLAQRAINREAPPLPPVAEQVADAGVGGPVAVGSALPAPAESTIPAPYLTPGLEAPAEDFAIAATPSVRPAFNPRGAVHGAAAKDSMIALQARKTITLTVRGPDGKTTFGRVLSAGDAYRAPMVPGLSLEVSDPAGVDVFRGGEYVGVLAEPVTPLAKLAG